LSRLYGLIQVN